MLGLSPIGAAPLADDAAADGGYTLIAETGSFALVGQNVGLLADRALPINTGIFSLVGQSADLSASRILTIGTGSFALSGHPASLLASRLIAAGTGGFALAGHPVNILAQRVLLVDAGAFSLTGQDVALNYSGGGYILVAETGNFAVAGQDIALRAARYLALEAGAFSMTGQDAGLAASRYLPVVGGSFSMTGQDVGLTASRLLALAQASFAFSGQSVSLRVARLLPIGTGSFLLAGQDVIMSTGGISEIFAGPENSVAVYPSLYNSAQIYGYTEGLRFMAFFIKQGDTGPALRATLRDGADVAYDLTGASVRFHMRAVGASSASVDASADLVTAENGVVQYDWQSGDTATAGIYHGEFEVTHSTGEIETFPNGAHIRIEIQDDIA